MQPGNARKRAACSVAIIVLVLTFGRRTVVAQSADQLAQELATLRADVESLSEGLAEAKTDTKNELQALSRQKSDLQLELDREKIRLQKLRSVLDEKKLRLDEVSKQGEDLKPVFDTALQSMRSYVATSLPFRRNQRLAELDKLKEQQQSGVLSHAKALVRLWSFVEDELRISKESGSFQQTIEVDGVERLAQVLRVGMVMLYYEAPDGTTGYAQRATDGWKFVPTTNSEQQKQVHHLFDSFKKQIRVGLFNIPTPFFETFKGATL